jgi:hypothetical protein
MEIQKIELKVGEKILGVLKKILRNKFKSYKLYQMANKVKMVEET